MTSYNFKQDLLRIEQELRDISEGKRVSPRTRIDIMTELYCLLHSNQSLRYFTSIFRKSGAQNGGVAKDVEDYLSEAYMSIETKLPFQSK